MKKITDNLFYLFIFLLPWQTVFILREPMIGGEKWQYGTIGIYLTDIILLTWLSLILYKKFFTDKQADKFQNLKSKYQIKSKIPSFKQIQNLNFKSVTSYWLLVTGCLVLWSFISIFWSTDNALAFYFSLKLLLGAGLFLALQRVKINWRKVVFVFLAAAVLQSVLAMGQFAFQESFSSKWLGMNNYEAWQGGVSVLENEGGRWLRAYGSLPHPNILGGYLVVMFLLGLGGYLIVGRKMEMCEQDLRKRLSNFFKSPLTPLFQRGRSNFLPLEKGEFKRDLKPSNRITKLFILSSLLIILMGILLTFSRSAWLALAVGIVFLGINIGLRKNFINLLLIFSLAGIIFININHENFFTRFDAGKRLEQKSISERSLYFNQSKEIIKENFWLGTGAGNYTWAVFQKDKIKKPIWQYQPVHNVFILIWAELGIIGLTLFLIILTLLFLKSLKSENSLYWLLVTSYWLLIFDHWLWTTHFGILLFWLIAGLATKKKQ